VAERKKYDLSSPGAGELRKKIVQGAYVTEGTMVAFPTCVPAVTIPLPADESHITALDVTDEGIVYAGTSGYAAHLLVGVFHGATGMVLDMGVVEGADQTVAVCCGNEKLIGVVNGPGGGKLVMSNLQPEPFDLIQEWFIARGTYEYLDDVAGGEKILHAVTDESRRKMIGVSESKLFTVDIETARVSVVGEVPGKARLARGSGGCVFGPDEGDTLWRYDPESGELRGRALKLPHGDWRTDPLMWARDTTNGLLYLADAQGALFSFAEDAGFSGPLGKIPLAPVGAMAVTYDGRLFGAAGDGISRFFCYAPGTGEIRDLGVAVSVLERRRYGYTFGDAVVGRNGCLVFGENDDLGHLWLYFPSIPKR